MYMRQLYLTETENDSCKGFVFEVELTHAMEDSIGRPRGHVIETDSKPQIINKLDIVYK